MKKLKTWAVGREEMMTGLIKQKKNENISWEAVKLYSKGCEAAIVGRVGI